MPASPRPLAAEELRKRVMRELRELHRDQQRQLHGLYTKEWTRKEEVRDAEEETKRRQRSGQDPSLEDRYAHGARPPSPPR